MPYLIPFGKHKGAPITEVPGQWLEWAAENLDKPDVKAECQKELARRRGGDGPATGHGKPAAAPASAGPVCPSCQALRAYLFSLFSGSAAADPGEVPF